MADKEQKVKLLSLLTSTRGEGRVNESPAEGAVTSNQPDIYSLGSGLAPPLHKNPLLRASPSLHTSSHRGPQVAGARTSATSSDSTMSWYAPTSDRPVFDPNRYGNPKKSKRAGTTVVYPVNAESTPPTQPLTASSGNSHSLNDKNSAQSRTSTARRTPVDSSKTKPCIVTSEDHYSHAAAPALGNDGQGKYHGHMTCQRASNLSQLRCRNPSVPWRLLLSALSTP
jgi:hypothetical protein